MHNEFFFFANTPAGNNFFSNPPLKFHTSSSQKSTERKQIIKMYLGDLPL